MHVVEQQITSSALHRLLLEYIGALLLMTLTSVVTGWLLAGRALAPLRAITATARRVSGENLGERIALADPDATTGEPRAMGEAIRETVDRCERLISSLLLLGRSEATTGHEEAVDIAAWWPTASPTCARGRRRHGSR